MRCPCEALGRLNLRLILFVALLMLPFSWIGYVTLNQTVTGGVHHYADRAEVDLKSMGFFNFNPRDGKIEDVPSQFRALDGSRVALEGFMWNPNAAGPKVRDFQFVYNVAVCCFGGPPKVQERVFARCPAGTSVPLVSNEQVRLIGILHVNVQHNELGDVTSVYTLDVEKVERHRGWF